MYVLGAERCVATLLEPLPGGKQKSKGTVVRWKAVPALHWEPAYNQLRAKLYHLFVHGLNETLASPCGGGWWDWNPISIVVESHLFLSESLGHNAISRSSTQSNLKCNLSSTRMYAPSVFKAESYCAGTSWLSVGPIQVGTLNVSPSLKGFRLR